MKITSLMYIPLNYLCEEIELECKRGLRTDRLCLRTGYLLGGLQTRLGGELHI